MAWIYLFVAGVLEVVWALAMKASDGFRHFWASLLTVVALAASMILLAMALRKLPVGTAYPIWTGIGAIGAALMGVLMFGEPRSLLKVASVGLIVLGIAGLRMSTPPEDDDPPPLEPPPVVERE